MTLLDVDASPLRGRTIRSAALHLQKAGEERLWRVTVSSVGAEWFEGTGSSYAVQPGGATFRHRRHPDLPWSIGGGDLCHVDPGQRRHDLADGRRLAARSRRLADRAGRPEGHRGPSGRTQLRLPRLRRHRLGVDPPGRVVHASGSFPTASPTAGTRTGRAPRIFDSRARAPRTAGRPRPRAACASSRGRRALPAGEALVSWVTPRDAGPAGTLGFFAELDGRAVAARADPDGRRAGRPGRDAPARPEAAAGESATLSVRAVDAAGNLGPAATASIRVSDRLPAPLPQPPTASSPPPSAATKTLPRLGSIEVAILDELDKVHPDHGRADPRPAGGLPGRQSPLGCRRATDHAPGGAERVRRLPGPAARRRCRPIGTRSGPSWTSTPRPARRRRSSSAAITR